MDFLAQYILFFLFHLGLFIVAVMSAAIWFVSYDSIDLLFSVLLCGAGGVVFYAYYIGQLFALGLWENTAVGVALVVSVVSILLYGVVRMGPRWAREIRRLTGRSAGRRRVVKKRR